METITYMDTDAEAKGRALAAAIDKRTRGALRAAERPQVMHFKAAVCFLLGDAPDVSRAELYTIVLDMLHTEAQREDRIRSCAAHHAVLAPQLNRHPS